MARPAAKIDLKQLGQLAALQCTDEEIAAVFGVTAKTIQRRKKSAGFAAALEHGRLKGKVSVRRRLFAIMNQDEMRAAAAAGIFLAKNLLGYRDAGSIEITGSNGGPVQLEHDLSKLSDDELRTIRELARKTAAAPGSAGGADPGQKKPA